MIKRMRWRAFFFLKGDQTKTEDHPDSGANEHFGFKSRKCPPRVEELEAFEDDLLKMIESVQSRRVSDDFQKRLRKDTERIQTCKDVIVHADKTRNLYTVSKEEYNKLLRNNITKNYKPAPARTYDNINREAQVLANALELSDRMESMAKKDVFITLKDHKENFSSARPCRLINPAKTEIGNISNGILDRILTDVRAHVRLNTW